MNVFFLLLLIRQHSDKNKLETAEFASFVRMKEYGPTIDATCSSDVSPRPKRLADLDT